MAALNIHLQILLADPRCQRAQPTSLRLLAALSEEIFRGMADLRDTLDAGAIPDGHVETGLPTPGSAGARGALKTPH